MANSDQSPAVRGILLDIEGTTSSISFVHDVMFPYVLQRLDAFLHERWQCADLQATCQQIAQDAAGRVGQSDASGQLDPVQIAAEVRQLMAGDVKATGLKALQGLIWEGGFHSGELVAHVYPDVLPAIERWRQAGIDVRIYSSGSIAAQKLFFGHVANRGDCLSLFSGHYDTTSGGKKESDSYARIADDWQLAPTSILFVSDIAGELQAAQQAGLQTRASVRPGNAPLPDSLQVIRIGSFEEIA